MRGEGPVGAGVDDGDPLGVAEFDRDGIKGVDENPMGILALLGGGGTGAEVEVEVDADADVDVEAGEDDSFIDIWVSSMSVGLGGNFLGWVADLGGLCTNLSDSPTRLLIGGGGTLLGIEFIEEAVDGLMGVSGGVVSNSSINCNSDKVSDIKFELAELELELTSNKDISEPSL